MTENKAEMDYSAGQHLIQAYTNSHPGRISIGFVVFTAEVSSGGLVPGVNLLHDILVQTQFSTVRGLNLNYLCEGLISSRVPNIRVDISRRFYSVQY
jgi:hypothetical protein